MDARNLVETLRGRGLFLRVEGDRIKVEAPEEPDIETKALVEELRTHKEEIRAILEAPACWNCAATMSETTDIYGRSWWACWNCARTI